MSSESMQDAQLHYLEHLCLGCMAYRQNLDVPCACGWREDSQNEPHQLSPGSSLAGRYMVGRALGEGGFGITYLGWSLKQNKKVAIKEFYPGNKMVTRESDCCTVTPRSDTQIQQLFQRGRDKFFDESQILAAFDDDPNIVNVEDFFKENGTAYIVMEFIEGCTLSHYLETNGAMSLATVLNRFSPLIDSLDRIHQNRLLHRDISPDNIMLTNNGGIKLLDFGTARGFSLEGERNNTVFFKMGYAPLEQFYSRGKQGPWTDEHALAATIYRSITGSTPPAAIERESGESSVLLPRSLGADITLQQEAVLLKGMALKHSDRYPTVREFYSALEASPNDGRNQSGLFNRLLTKIKSLPRWFAPAALVAVGALVIMSTNSPVERAPSTPQIEMSVNGKVEPSETKTSAAPTQSMSAVETPVVETPAVKTLADFHASITQRKLGQAFNCLDSDMQNHMGGYDSWATGFATTVSSTPLNIKVVDESSDRVVLTYTLETVDDPGGKNYFDGTVTVIKTGSGWKIADIKNKIR